MAYSSVFVGSNSLALWTISKLKHNMAMVQDMLDSKECWMSREQKTRRLIVAMQRRIKTTFTEEEWDELATLTGCETTVFRHNRLIRSFYFGDDDYEFHIAYVLREMIDSNPANLQIIVDYLELESWLSAEHPQEYVKLFGHTHLLIDELRNSAVSNSIDVNQYILRIQDFINSDPELAIGSTKELLEGLMKNILKEHGVCLTGSEDLPKLLKKTQKTLKLDPNSFDSSAKGGNLIKRTLSNLVKSCTGSPSYETSMVAGTLV